MTAAIAIIALGIVSFILNSTIREGMTISDIQVSEHADELSVALQMPSFEPGSIITVGHWSKDEITISFFPRGLEDSAEITRYLKEILINTNATSSNGTSWPAVLSDLSKRSTGIPTLKLLKDSDDAADIKVILEGAQHPEGKIGYAVVSRDSANKLKEVEISLFSSYEIFQDGYISHIFAHELGHALGLGHATSMSSIMHNRLVIVNDELVGKIRGCEVNAVDTLYGTRMVKDLECQ